MNPREQGALGAATGGALAPSTHTPATAELVQAFETSLKRDGLTPGTVRVYLGYVRRFATYVGDEGLDRIGDQQVKAFFRDTAPGKREKGQVAFVIGRFLRFAAARRPPQPRNNAQTKELTVEQWREAKERADDLIAKLGRRLIECYVYLEELRHDAPVNLDEVNRLTDDCRELLKTNLPLFLTISADGKNIHTLIDRWSQR